MCGSGGVGSRDVRGMSHSAYAEIHPFGLYRGLAGTMVEWLEILVLAP